MFLYAWLHLSGYRALARRDEGVPAAGSRRRRATPSSATRRASRRRPARSGRASATPSAWRSPAKMVGGPLQHAPSTRIFDHTIWCLAGDGCMQEGVAAEAAAFAGHLKLDNLILIYDSNDVTLDAMAAKTQSEDTAKRFEAIRLRRSAPRPGQRHRSRSTRSLSRARELASRGKPQLHHRAHAHRQGHPGGRGHAEGARRGGREVRRRRPRRARAARGDVLRLRRGADLLRRAARAELGKAYTRVAGEDLRRLAREEPRARAGSSTPRSRAARARRACSAQDPAVSRRRQARHAQGGRDGAAAGGHGSAARSSARSADLYGSTLQLHRRRRATSTPTHRRRPQHPHRHPRARHGRDHERHRLPRRRAAPAARPSWSSPTTCGRASASRRCRTCR